LILLAATDELQEAGIVGFRIRGVAERADIAPATIYRYFPDREALLAGAMLSAQDQCLAEQAEFARRVTAGARTVDEAAAAISVWMTSAFNASSHALRWRIAEYVTHAEESVDATAKPSQSPLLDITVEMLERVAMEHPLRPGISTTGLAKLIVASYFGLLIFSGDERVDDKSASDFGLALGELVRRAFATGANEHATHPETYDVLVLDRISRPVPVGSSRRQQIAAHAAELFSEARSGAFEVSDVAKRVGIPASSIYRYFATKDDLIGEAAVSAFDDIRTDWSRTTSLVAELFRTSSREEIPSLMGAFGENGKAPSIRERRLKMLRSLVFARASEGSSASFQRLAHLAVDEAIETFAVLETRGLLSPRVSPAAASFLLLSPLLGMAMFDYSTVYDLPAGEGGYYLELLMDEVVLAPGSDADSDDF